MSEDSTASQSQLSPMAPGRQIALSSVISPWPIADNLARHLPAGDLINLSRANAILRSALHDFELPAGHSPPETIRPSLHIGGHQTSHWRKLKEKSPFLCASRTHTRGDEVHPCKYCSRPICQACLVRDSFKNRGRQPFKSRCRYLCKGCWQAGTPQRKRRFPATSSEQPEYLGWNDPAGDRSFCECTPKDSYVCIECQDEQDKDEVLSEQSFCMGEGCKDWLGPSFDTEKLRRTICLWCDQPVQRSRISGESQHTWTQKIIDARARREESRQADLEEYNRNRLRELRMSRRQLRGDGAVKGDSDADIAQFVRHLDTVNYHKYMSRETAPSGDAVYASKAGKFTYKQAFLEKFRNPCSRLPIKPHLRAATKCNDQGFARTNADKSDQSTEMMNKFHGEKLENQKPWHHLKAQIIQRYIVENTPLSELRDIIDQDYHFRATVQSYVHQIDKWGFGQRLLFVDLPTKIEQFHKDKGYQPTDHEVAKMAQEEYDRELAEQMEQALDLNEDISDLEQQTVADAAGPTKPSNPTLMRDTEIKHQHVPWDKGYNDPYLDLECFISEDISRPSSQSSSSQRSQNSSADLDIMEGDFVVLDKGKSKKRADKPKATAKNEVIVKAQELKDKDDASDDPTQNPSPSIDERAHPPNDEPPPYPAWE